MVILTTFLTYIFTVFTLVSGGVEKYTPVRGGRGGGAPLSEVRLRLEIMGRVESTPPHSLALFPPNASFFLSNTPSSLSLSPFLFLCTSQCFTWFYLFNFIFLFSLLKHFSSHSLYFYIFILLLLIRIIIFHILSFTSFIFYITRRLTYTFIF